MSKYKIGDVFIPNEIVISARPFDRAEVVAFTPEGSAILRIAKPSGGRFLLDDLVGRSDQVLSDHYTLVKPKPAFFEVDKFYRFKVGTEPSTKYTRYEIKEVFETLQNDGTFFRQAHAEKATAFVVCQTFLDAIDFGNMIKM